ncbi:hypothetical protein H6504_02275 [Candidatus Woesearchaeota archaeon]|nr:hypothetical protein [Candidatus Woesearchaeota archaeon]
MKFVISTDAYSVREIMAAAYLSLGNAYVSLDKTSGGIEVDITPRGEEVDVQGVFMEHLTKMKSHFSTDASATQAELVEDALFKPIRWDDVYGE